MTQFKICHACTELFRVEDSRRDFLCPECEQLPIAIEGKDRGLEEEKEKEEK